jgi:Ser/Thr protein kinase RdoA (MazF antagonist)
MLRFAAEPKRWMRVTAPVCASLRLSPACFCHGDFHGWNAHVDETQQLTFFDFDCCGKGWRAYDIATFFWGARIRDKHKKRCSNFLRGYTEVRQLSDADLASIPYFVAVRHIWLVGVLAANGSDLGFGWMDDKYMDRQIKLWREMESECFTKTIHETYLQ